MRARSTPLLERRLGELASRQHGVVTRAQLLQLGFGRGAIVRRIDAGRLIPVHAGVYLVGHRACARLATEMAAVLASGPGAALSHQSAAVRWGLVTRTRQTLPVEVTVARRWAPQRPGIRVHRREALEACDVTALERIATTTPARTLLDLAARFGVEQLEAAYAEAERRHGLTREALADQLDRNRGRLGAATLRALLARDQRPALTRSVAERKLLALLRERGIAAPQTNRRVAGFEVDLFWEEAGVVVEFDSFGFHADRGAFERDRRRDAELAAHGFRVLRVTWRQLVDHPGAVVSRIGRTLVRATSEWDRARIADRIPR